MAFKNFMREKKHDTIQAILSLNDRAKLHNIAKKGGVKKMTLFTYS